MILQYDGPETKTDFAAIVVSKGYHTGAEIGVRAGEMAKIIMDTGVVEKYYLIDPWKHQDPQQYHAEVNYSDQDFEQVYQGAMKLLENYRDKIEIYREYSHDAVCNISDESLDWVYVDGNHAFHWTLQDLDLWYSKVKPGCMIAGHDFLDFDFPHRFGVKTAVRVFFPQDQVIHTSKTEWPIWWTIKR